jgi:hypothetical protein
VWGQGRGLAQRLDERRRRSPSSRPLSANSHPRRTRALSGGARGGARLPPGADKRPEPENGARTSEVLSQPSGSLSCPLYNADPCCHSPPLPQTSPPLEALPFPPAIITLLCYSSLIQTSNSTLESFPAIPAAPPHQIVLCSPPQEPKCRAFPAKTCLRHSAANPRTPAVKQDGVHCRVRRL